MVALTSLFLALIASLLVVRVATVALSLTGLSRELARFQARSAFTGAGFTTSESEAVLSHPVRRRLIMLLMLLGNAGIVSVVSSLVLSMSALDEQTGWTGSLWFRMTLLIAGVAGLWTLAHSEWLDRRMSRMIAWALKRWTNLEVRDYAGLLHLSGDYTVAELQLEADDWLAGQELADSRLSDEGVLVLGIERAGGKYLGAPRGDTVLEAGDTLLMYGRGESLENLDERRSGASGNWEHHKAVDKQRQVQREETSSDQPTAPVDKQ